MTKRKTKRKEKSFISVDPGKQCGVAHFVDGDLWYCTACDPETVCDRIDMERPDAVVVEDLFPGAVAWKAIKTLVEIAGYICWHAKSKGISVYRYYPSQWHKVLGVKNRKENDYKKVSLQEASKYFGIKISNSNAADAINMGRWHLEKTKEK